MHVGKTCATGHNSTLSSTPDPTPTPCLPLLQELHLDQTFVTADGLAGVLEGCQQLRSLSVGARGSSSWPAPAGPLQGLCLPSQAPINNTLLTSVAAHCKNLEELRISGELPAHSCGSTHSWRAMGLQAPARCCWLANCSI